MLLSSSVLAPPGFKEEARRVQDSSSMQAHGTAGKPGVSSTVAGGSSCCWLLLATRTPHAAEHWGTLLRGCP